MHDIGRELDPATVEHGYFPLADKVDWTLLFLRLHGLVASVLRAIE